MTKIVYLVLCLVAAILTKVSAITEEEKASLRSAISECFSEYGVSYEKVVAATETKTTGNIDPCFIGCGFKKVNLIDSNGKFSPDKGLAVLKTIVKGDQDIADFENIAKNCLKVNDQPVSDGDAGCQRAMFMVACAFEHNFKILI